MDDEIETLMVEVRASTQGFRSDIETMRGALDQREQRAELFLGGDERGEGRAEDTVLSGNGKRGLATARVGLHHAGTTAPELSSCSV